MNDLEYRERTGTICPNKREIAFYSEGDLVMSVPTPIPIEIGDAVYVVEGDDGNPVVVSIERNGSVIWPQENEA